MLQPRNLYHPQVGHVHGFEVDLSSIEPWHPVVTQVRQMCLSRQITGASAIEMMNPAYSRFCPTERDVQIISDMCAEAATKGRLIDFGQWTQDTIIYAGKRGGPLYGKGMIGHPFREPYLFMHTWEGEGAVYLVNPLEPEKPSGDTECVEFNPLIVGGNKMLMIADRVTISPTRSPNLDDYNKYYCESIPSVWRMIYAEHNPDPGAKSPANAAAGNVLDPLMAALLILSTRGIERERVETPPKLARARMKNGKPPIPPYERVNSAPYVTAISLRKARGRKPEGKGGHHASPVMHLRMGHPRTYASGVQTFVRDALVNATEETRAAWAGNRSHYTVKG